MLDGDLCPAGAFRVEMDRESEKDRTIMCNFDPTEIGMYVIHVLWSNVDVPGSPFHVHILDTKSQLEQVLSDPTFLQKQTISMNGSRYDSTKSQLY